MAIIFAIGAVTCFAQSLEQQSKETREMVVIYDRVFVPSGVLFNQSKYIEIKCPPSLDGLYEYLKNDIESRQKDVDFDCILLMDLSSHLSYKLVGVKGEVTQSKKKRELIYIEVSLLRSNITTLEAAVAYEQSEHSQEIIDLMKRLNNYTLKITVSGHYANKFAKPEKESDYTYNFTKEYGKELDNYLSNLHYTIIEFFDKKIATKLDISTLSLVSQKKISTEYPCGGKR